MASRAHPAVIAVTAARGFFSFLESHHAATVTACTNRRTIPCTTVSVYLRNIIVIIFLLFLSRIVFERCFVCILWHQFVFSLLRHVVKCRACVCVFFQVTSLLTLVVDVYSTIVFFFFYGSQRKQRSSVYRHATDQRRWRQQQLLRYVRRGQNVVGGIFFRFENPE